MRGDKRAGGTRMTVAGPGEADGGGGGGGGGVETREGR